ncbi:MAG: hypothetical protein NTU59_06830 [Coprothermobacterota bacterium]|nr:hypothetical protein [Coprothermobacterota bacterium]
MNIDPEKLEQIEQIVVQSTGEDLQREGLKEYVEPWEDGYRTHDHPQDTFEWWYLDADLEDGSSTVIVFNTKPHTHPQGPLAPSAGLLWRHPDGKREQLADKRTPEEFSASTEGCDVHIGPSWLKGDLNRYEMHTEIEGVIADFVFQRGSPSWRPGAAKTYLDKAKTRYFAWVVPVPYGTVEGTITRDGKTIAVKGTGYHDHNWGNILLNGMYDHWYWGRAHLGDYSVIYVQITTLHILGGIKLPVFYLAKGDKILVGDGLPLSLITDEFVKDEASGRSYPTKLDFDWHREKYGSVHLTIRNPQIIGTLDLLDSVPRWERPLIRLFSNPHYFDFDADIILTVDLQQEQSQVNGRTIYELMLLR